MRLGAYSCKIAPKTISLRAYKNRLISERHRHRYELNNTYKEKLEQKGLVIAGINPETNLVEIIELPTSNSPRKFRDRKRGMYHPFFVATQFHPEFKSRPLTPHPLFRGFIKACLKRV